MIDDVAKHAAVEDSVHRRAHRRLSPLQKPAPGSRTHAQIVPKLSTSSNDLDGVFIAQIGDVRASNLGRQSH